jgi:hypothetical protein
MAFKKAKLISLAIVLLMVFSSAIVKAQTASGPLAAAYSLLLVSKQGYPNLCLNEKNDAEAIKKLVKILSSPRSMAGGIDIGTATAFPIIGLDLHIRHSGYRLGYLKFQGFRPHPYGYSAGTTPYLNWICAGTRAKAGECALVGWYQYDNKNIYKRIGGQWLSVVGYQPGNSKDCPIILAVIDPSNGQRSWLYFDKLKSGRLMEFDSHGISIRTMYPEGSVYKILSKIKSEGIPILEGAVVFRLM